MLLLLVLWRQRIARQEIETLIANRLTLEQQLWQAQKLDAVGRLAGGIAHDFNNVLTAISSHAQLLRGGHTTDVAAEATEIQFATERAAALVRRLLSFTRASATERTLVAPAVVVRSMERMLRQLTRADVALDFDVAVDRSVVSMADGQLEQILLNLVINSRDATPDGGRITVRSNTLSVADGDPMIQRGVEPGEWAVLEVEDTGTGMDAATRDAMFEPFFSTKTTTGGTGLGLATVAGIVAAANGHILVKSAPGRGTTITVLLPAAAPAPELGETERPQPGTPRAQSILVVDDEAPIRSALSRFLARRGYDVLEAPSAAAAIVAMERRDWTVDLILTDVQMPGGTGLELAAQVRKRRAGIPVLFMTGYAPVDGDAAASRARDSDTIAKPFDLEVVAERIRVRLLDTPR